MAVSTDDHISIADFMARYCWLVDEGDEAGWTALWAEDGVFTGASPEPFVGRAALGAIPRGQGRPGGPMRHMITNLACDYADSRDTVHARYYNTVTNWADGCKPVCLALSRLVLRRSGNTWLIERNDSTMLMG